MIRVAVLGGTGRWGRNIVKTLQNMKDAQLAWATGSKEDWKRKLNDARPHAVAIATPANMHAMMALEAMKLDLPVFIEKPMATTVQDAEAILKMSEDRKLPVMVDHIHLFNPGWRELKKRSPELGTLTEAVSEAGNAGPFRQDISPLWDWGPHDVAMAIDLAGSPPSEFGPEPDKDGNDRFRLEFRNGLVWRAHVGSRFAEKTRRAVVRGTNAEAVWDDLAEVKLRIAGQRVACAGESPLAVALGEFVASVRDRKAAVPCSGAALGVEVVRVLAGL